MNTGERINKTVTITEKAPAKINLVLDILGRREDGYHEIRTIMEELSLCDEVTLTKDEKEIRISVGFGEESGNLYYHPGKRPEGAIPEDARNLAVKAALLLQQEYPQITGVSIELTKRIPSAAGLAGGSADAAAVIRGLNRLFSLGLSAEKMCILGKQIGADVPYCVAGKTALAEGIGEKLTVLPRLKRLPVLLIKPDREISTKAVYEALDTKEEPLFHPAVDACIADLRCGDNASLCRHMGNLLEEVTVPMLPEIRNIKEFLISAGAKAAQMSGSGPTVFAVFDTDEARNLAFDRAIPEFPESWSVIAAEAGADRRG